MIRKAVENDIEAIGKTYESLLTYEAIHGGFSNWKLGIYPTVAVAEEKVPTGTMYVLEEDGNICASMILNNEQAPEYDAVAWKYQALPEQVMVIHTLCIPPEMAGRGYGKQMIAFAKEYARANGYTVIRIDTYADNEPAKALYLKNGFRIAGYGDSLLQGLIEEKEAYLEYLLQGPAGDL